MNKYISPMMEKIILQERKEAAIKTAKENVTRLFILISGLALGFFWGSI